MILLTRLDQRFRLGRVQTILVVATLALVNSVALHMDIQRYVSGNNHAALSLDSHVSWWWTGLFSPNVDWLGGSLAYAVMLVLIVREISRRDSATPVSGDRVPVLSESVSLG